MDFRRAAVGSLVMAYLPFIIFNRGHVECFHKPGNCSEHGARIEVPFRAPPLTKPFGTFHGFL